jgi:hypothetical protein
LGQHTEQKGLAFYDRTAAWTLPEISVDVTRLKQALVNLLSNAVKYNRDGGTVTLSVEEGRDGMFRITVIDTGPGIAEEKQDQLFTPFARLGLENSDITGTGIGLTITKDLTEAMGGAIGFKSTLGLGSRFWLEFPIVGGSLEPRASGDIPAAAGEGDISITGSDGKTVHRDIGAKGIKGNTLVGTSDLDDEVGDPLVLTIQPEFSVRRIPPGLAGLGIDGDSAASGIDPESAVGYRNRARGFGCRQGNIIRLKIIAAKING